MPTPSCLPQIRLKFVVFGGTLRVCFAKVPVRVVGVDLLIFCPCDHGAYFFGNPVSHILEAKARPESGSQKIVADPIGVADFITSLARVCQSMPCEICANTASAGLWFGPCHTQIHTVGCDEHLHGFFRFGVKTDHTQRLWSVERQPDRPFLVVSQFRPAFMQIIPILRNGRMPVWRL